MEIALICLLVVCLAAAVLLLLKLRKTESALAMNVEAKIKAEKELEALKTAQQSIDVIRSQMEAQAKESRAQQLEALEAKFSKVTEELLKKREEELSKNNDINMSSIVNPLKEKLEEMRKVVEESQRSMADNTKEQEGTRTSIKSNIDTLVEKVLMVSQSADRLSKALTTENKTQGNWGETQLEMLLKAQGMEEGLHYDKQEVIRDAKGNVVTPESGSRMQPDVILHLDETRELIIDAKVSLAAYVEYCNAASEGDKQLYLAQHIRSVKDHVKELAKKDYSSYIKPPKQSLNYVMMFMPANGALQLALDNEPSLWREAINQGVFIVGEQNLFAALKVVQLAWIQITQNANHQQVYELADELIDRVGMFLEMYDNLGKHLQKASEVYVDVKKKATEGQSILTSAKKLVKLGAQQSKKHPLPAAEADFLQIDGNNDKEKR
ncbi:MAG: DNA recombination protein RmuC [Paludibacteraceae bacterium]|nr:DNA recombination protein RmuC [Paludibacteraceae bacterium]